MSFMEEKLTLVIIPTYNEKTTLLLTEKGSIILKESMYFNRRR